MDLPTTISLTVLTLIALTATVLGVLRLRSGDSPTRLQAAHRACVWVCTIGSLAVFLYRVAMDYQRYHDVQPLRDHADGLTLMAALLGGAVLYLQYRSRLPGVGAFAGPLLTLMLAWAICASNWTLKVFAIHSVWKSVHLTSVYVGSMFFTVAAILGGMYLYGQRRLRRKDAPPGPARFASLETIERLIIRASALGFTLLTLGLITGVVIVTSHAETKLGEGWWHSPKVVLAAVVWLIYALVMNVRHATTFRGARAAWLSIVGLVLLLATMMIAINLPPLPQRDAAARLSLPQRPTTDVIAPLTTEVL